MEGKKGKENEGMTFVLIGQQIRGTKMEGMELKRCLSHLGGKSSLFVPFPSSMLTNTL